MIRVWFGLGLNTGHTPKMRQVMGAGTVVTRVSIAAGSVATRRAGAGRIMRSYARVRGSRY